MKRVSIQEAHDQLISGGVVAIPTETVYGLAGWIYSEDGLKRIFSTKERPFFDPLIVHVESIEKAKQLTSDWTEVHQALAEAAWPGPLTLIAKKNDKINSLITSGLDSVGLRCPNHSETLKLLSMIDGGLAAPSANKFGKTSPTSSAHVEEEFLDEVSILEGGNCDIGIESTVAGVKKINDEFVVEIYRPGFFTATLIENILKDKKILAQVKYTESPVAPGQLKHHYMPKIPLIIVPVDFNWEHGRHKIEDELGKKFLRPKLWVLSRDAHMASRELYQDLRQFDQEGFDIIVTSRLDHQHTEEWIGIWNRLNKAKTLTL